MIFPLTAYPSDITRPIQIEEIAPTGERYPAFETKHSTSNELYKSIQVGEATKTTINKNNTVKDFAISHNHVESVSSESVDYSSAFIDFQTKSFIQGISKNLNVWSEEGTDESIVQIANIRQLLEEYSKYLVITKEARLLLAGLELIFENNDWENFPIEKVRRLRNIFLRFHSSLEIRDIRIFMSELHSQKITVMDNNYEKTEK